MHGSKLCHLRQKTLLAASQLHNLQLTFTLCYVQGQYALFVSSDEAYLCTDTTFGSWFSRSPFFCMLCEQAHFACLLIRQVGHLSAPTTLAQCGNCQFKPHQPVLSLLCQLEAVSSSAYRTGTPPAARVSYQLQRYLTRCKVCNKLTLSLCAGRVCRGRSCGGGTCPPSPQTSS